MCFGIQMCSVPWGFLYLARLQAIEVDETEEIRKLHTEFFLAVLYVKKKKRMQFKMHMRKGYF